MSASISREKLPAEGSRTDAVSGVDQVFLEEEMTATLCRRFLDGEAAVFSTRCPGKTTPNEDAAALLGFGAASGVVAVCDGAGGTPEGEHASRIAVRELRAEIEEARREEVPLRSAILNGMEAANRELLALGSGAATTSAIVEIQDELVRPYHVGDTMILVIGQRGRIKLQTISHSPVGFALESGMLDETEAIHHEDRHLVSNLVGRADMSIEIGPQLPLARRDTLLLASDGVFDNLYVDEVVSLVRKGPLAEAARNLVERVLERMSSEEAGKPSKPDDLTFVLYRRAGPGGA